MKYVFRTAAILKLTLFVITYIVSYLISIQSSSFDTDFDKLVLFYSAPNPCMVFDYYPASIFGASAVGLIVFLDITSYFMLFIYTYLTNDLFKIILAGILTTLSIIIAVNFNNVFSLDLNKPTQLEEYSDEKLLQTKTTDFQYRTYTVFEGPSKYVYKFTNNDTPVHIDLIFKYGEYFIGFNGDLKLAYILKKSADTYTTTKYPYPGVLQFKIVDLETPETYNLTTTDSYKISSIDIVGTITKIQLRHQSDSDNYTKFVEKAALEHSTPYMISIMSNVFIIIYQNYITDNVKQVLWLKIISYAAAISSLRYVTSLGLVLWFKGAKNLESVKDSNLFLRLFLKTNVLALGEWIIWLIYPIFIQGSPIISIEVNNSDTLGSFTPEKIIGWCLNLLSVSYFLFDRFRNVFVLYFSLILYILWVSILSMAMRDQKYIGAILVSPFLFYIHAISNNTENISKKLLF